MEGVQRASWHERCEPCPETTPAAASSAAATSSEVFVASISADTRAMIGEVLGRPPGVAGPCVALVHDPESWHAGPCPHSLGNRVHAHLSGLLLAVLLNASVVQSAPFTCQGLIAFRRSVPVDLRRSQRSRTLPRDGVECRLARASSADQLIAGLPPSQGGECVRVASGVNAQEMGALALGAARDDARVRRLFSLGASFAFGALFHEAFEITPASLAGVDLGDADGASLRVSVHMRHQSKALNGSDVGSFVAALEGVLDASAVEGRRPPCSVLFASDRRAARRMFDAAARRLGCAFRTGADGMGGRVASGRSSNPEHGDDANGGALRDVMLLAQGDVMIGTFLSSFTLLVQELIAARAAADARTALAHPSVIYCGTGAVSIGEERSRRSPNSRCSPPQPLLPTRTTQGWHASLAGFPRSPWLRHDGEELCEGPRRRRLAPPPAPPPPLPDAGSMLVSDIRVYLSITYRERATFDAMAEPQLRELVRGFTWAYHAGPAAGAAYDRSCRITFDRWRSTRPHHLCTAERGAGLHFEPPTVTSLSFSKYGYWLPLGVPHACPRAAAPSFVADDAWVEVLRLGGDTPSGVPRAGDGCWFIVAAGSGVYVSVGRSSLRARTRNELAVQLGITHAVKRSASRRFGAYAVEAATPLCAAARARGFTSIQLWDEACTARSSPAACWLEIVSCHDACMAERRDEPDKTRRDSCADGLPLRTGLNATQPCMCEPGDVISTASGSTGPYKLLNCHGTARGELPVHVATAAPDTAPRCEVQSEGARASSHRSTPPPPSPPPHAGSMLISLVGEEGTGHHGSNGMLSQLLLGRVGCTRTNYGRGRCIGEPQMYSEPPSLFSSVMLRDVPAVCSQLHGREPNLLMHSWPTDTLRNASAPEAGWIYDLRALSSVVRESCNARHVVVRYMRGALQRVASASKDGTFDLKWAMLQAGASKTETRGVAAARRYAQSQVAFEALIEAQLKQLPAEVTVLRLAYDDVVHDCAATLRALSDLLRAHGIGAAGTVGDACARIVASNRKTNSRMRPEELAAVQEVLAGGR